MKCNTNVFICVIKTGKNPYILYREQRLCEVKLMKNRLECRPGNTARTIYRFKKNTCS